MEKNTNKLTASQRLEGLEQSLSLIDQNLGNLTMNLQTVVNAVTLISKKLEAVIRLGNAGRQITSEDVADQILTMNVEDLAEKVEDLKRKGVATPGDIVQENSFIVGRELDPETKLVSNRRIQFPLFGLKKEKKEILIGKKAGDIVVLEEGKNLLEITEVLNIVVPTAAKPAKEEAAAEQEVSTEQLQADGSNS